MTIPGIQAIGIAVPQFTLPLTALAEARGVDPAKYTEGLGTHRMSVAGPDDDAVTLAVRAARQAFALGNIDPSTIGLLIVGTETGVDHSKPVAAFVHGLLGLSWNCRSFETKHACFAATAGLQNALDWIRAGSARGKKALVIGTDIARYGLGSPGEPTQGAGAVAMVVSEEQPLVTFEDSIVGSFTRDVADFWRPLDSTEAIVDGQKSVDCYLHALAGAFREYQRVSREVRGGTARTADFAAMAYHVPYGKIALKAHRHLRSYETENATSSRDLARLRNDEESLVAYEERVAPGLVLPRQIGNIYTGALYLSLASTLLMSQRDLEGARLGLFSYGSGSCAEFFDCTVCEMAQDYARQANWTAMLDRQTVIDVPEYERLVRARDERAALRDVVPLAGEGPAFLGSRDRYRHYEG